MRAVTVVAWIWDIDNGDGSVSADGAGGTMRFRGG
jgi:hypothetical protein